MMQTSILPIFLFFYVFVNKHLQGKGEAHGSLLAEEANLVLLDYAVTAEIL